MKKALLYLLLFSYTSLVLKPVLPFITDTVAHIFWYSEHIATVHYEKGKYHVHYESLAEAKKNSPEKSIPVTKTETASSEHFMNTSRYDFSYQPLLSLHFSNPSFYLPHTWLANSYPPPKMI